MKAKTDEELMELYQHGDQAAFIELYSRYDGPLYGFIYNSLKVMAPALLADAGDIQQNMYAWIHQYRGRFVVGSVKPWLFTTADRRCAIISRARPVNSAMSVAPGVWCPRMGT